MCAVCFNTSGPTLMAGNLYYTTTLVYNSSITKYYTKYLRLFTFPDQDEVLAPTGQIGAVEDCEMTGLEARIGASEASGMTSFRLDFSGKTLVR